jgi:hypothetical protein
MEIQNKPKLKKVEVKALRTLDENDIKHRIERSVFQIQYYDDTKRTSKDFSYLKVSKSEARSRAEEFIKQYNTAIKAGGDKRTVVHTFCTICDMYVQDLPKHELSSKHLKNKIDYDDNHQKASCLYCNDVFNMDEYQSHIATEHHYKNKLETLIEKQNIAQEKVSTTIYCDDCSCNKTKAYYKRHLLNYSHKRNVDSNQKASCIYCNDVFNMDEYHSHIATEHHCKNKHDVLAEFWLIATH